MNYIKLEHWHWQCGDKCCDEYGTNLYVNDEHITDHYEGSIGDLEDVLKALNVEFEIEEVYEDD